MTARKYYCVTIEKGALDMKESRPVSDMLLYTGERFYKKGKLGIKLLIAGLIIGILFLVGQLLFTGEVYFFYESLAITKIIWVVSFALTGVGLPLTPLYFWGLHYMGLGQIAKNTNKE